MVGPAMPEARAARARYPCASTSAAKAARTEAADVLGEHADDLLVAHRLHLARDAHVVVGNQRDVRVAELQLPRERRLRMLGHVDDLPAGIRVRAGLRARREARALDDDDRAALVQREAGGPRAIDR